MVFGLPATSATATSIWASGAQLGQGPAGRGDVHGHLSQGEHVAEP